MSAANAVVMDHDHGVANNRCSHPDCAAAYARYIKQYRLDLERGKVRTVDADAARAHLVKLEGAGWSRRAIAGASGISPAAISRLALGQKTVRVPILRKLQAIDPASLPEEPSPGAEFVFVPRVGTVRRIQALLALGWTHAHITATSGTKTTVLLTQQGRWVARPTHDKVAAAYRELSQRPGPSALTRSRAAKLGYLTPAAWDDIDLDIEPDAELGDTEGDAGLDDVAIERRLAGDRDVELNKAEKDELVRVARERGWSYLDLERIGITKPERYIDREDDAA